MFKANAMCAGAAMAAMTLAAVAGCKNGNSDPGTSMETRQPAPPSHSDMTMPPTASVGSNDYGRNADTYGGSGNGMGSRANGSTANDMTQRGGMNSTPSGGMTPSETSPTASPGMSTGSPDMSSGSGRMNGSAGISSGAPQPSGGSGTSGNGAVIGGSVPSNSNSGR